MLKIYEFCEARGISPYKLAKELGYNRSTLSRWNAQGVEAFYDNGQLKIKKPNESKFVTYEVDLDA